MTQRKTQTAQYWQKEFTPGQQDIEAIYNHILEQNRPVVLSEIAIDLVRRHCDNEELANRNDLDAGKIYQPKLEFDVDDTLIFPALDFALGIVVASREGHHPDYGTFSVISVDFDGNTKEFAAGFDQPHLLNQSDYSLANLQGLMSPEELFEAYHRDISLKIRSALQSNDDFVSFHDQYFLNDMLPEFHEGLFNIADAAIDINNGPLNVNILIEQMGLAVPGQISPEVMSFSVSYQLANDERFDDVGPTGQILWYLQRIAPPEAHHPPRRLNINPHDDYDSALFDEDLKILLAEIDDEATKPEDIPEADPHSKQVTITINYPHWRVGTIPLTPKVQALVPISHFNPVLFDFVDGRTGDTIPVWSVLEHKYVFGLESWYQQNKLPVGAYITLKQTDDPMRIIIDYQATRTQRDWVRMANVSGNKLTFQMNPAPLGCQYDELMIIGEMDKNKVEAYWVKAAERNSSVYDILCNIFPELSKLNPQSTVHAKTLYSGVNVVRRTAPGAVFKELLSHDCFIPMNHGYWTYDPNLRD